MRLRGFLFFFVCAGCSLAVSESDYVGGKRSDAGLAPSDGGGNGDAADAGTEGGTEAGTNDDHLVAAWSFETLVGGIVVPDTTGHGHDGRFGANAKIEASDLSGSALVLGGGLDAMFVESLEAAAFPRTGTLSIHLKYADAGDSCGVVYNFAGTDHLFLRHAFGTPADEFQVAYQRENTEYAFVSDFAIPPNTWTHVVFTWSEALEIGRVYVNNELVHTAKYIGGPWAPSKQVFRIGDSFTGFVDELRLYDVAKSADEIP